MIGPAAGVVVTGSGHSGTALLTLALNYAGVAATHEGIFTFAGIRPWPSALRAEVSVAAMPHLAEVNGDRLIVVRDPLDTLNSFHRGRTFAHVCPCHDDGAHRGAPFTRYIFEHLPELEAVGDELGAALRYLPEWWKLGAPHAPTVRLEAILAGTDGALDLSPEVLAALPATYNAHGFAGPPRPPITWADVLDHPDGAAFATWASRLGYEVTP